MIPNQWYAVLESREVRKGKLLGVTRLGEKLVFARDPSGAVFCLRDRCAHRGAALSKGRLAGGNVECPFHGFQYDASGRGRLIPANGRKAAVPERFRVVSYPAFEKRGFVWIWWGENPPPDLGEPPFFSDIDGSFSHRTFVDPWNTHYSRAIENQLDVMHLPFVHHNTIGRGERTLVHGPVVERKSADHFLVRPRNEADAGQKPLAAGDIQPPHPDFHLEFRFPNLWQNWIAESMRVVAAFVPVDQEHTLVYLRFYQKFMNVPLLRGLANRLFMLFNIIILHQDRRVVETQTPKPSGVGTLAPAAGAAGPTVGAAPPADGAAAPGAPGVGAVSGAPSLRENLVQGDGPIAMYRMRRQALMNAAAHGSKAGPRVRSGMRPKPRRGGGSRGRRSAR